MASLVVINFFGEGALNEDMLTVNKLGMTRKSCGEQIDDLEQQLLSTLKEGAAINLNGEQLTLQGEHHFTFIAKN